MYARISRDKTGAGLGVDRQLRDGRDLADKLGWPVVATFEDNDLSAYSGKPRPAYRRLLAAIEAGEIEAVICWHTDRLHRSPAELEEWITVCEPRGVGVHTVKAGLLDLATPSGRMVARQLGAVARYESEHRSERVAAKMAEIAQSGGFLGGPRPFGYTADGMDLQREEADLIAEGTRALLDGGSLRSVTRAWNDAGTRTTKARRAWQPNTVRDVLMRARNAGLLQHRGQVIGKGRWPAIVTEDEWRGVCTVLVDESRRSTPGNEPRWIGSGLYRCAVCGSTMVVGTSGQRRNPSYRCRSAERGGPRHVTRAAPALDEFVERLIVARLSLDDALDLFAPAAPEVDHAALRAELARLDKQRTELAARLGRGEISLDMLDAANGPLLGRQTALRASLAAAEAAASPVAVLVQAEDVEASWTQLDLYSRRRVLDEVMTVTVHPAPRGRQAGGVYFDPSSIEITWKADER